MMRRYHRNPRVHLINGRRVVQLPAGVRELQGAARYLHRAYYPIKSYDAQGGLEGNVDTPQGQALTIIEAAIAQCWEVR